MKKMCEMSYDEFIEMFDQYSVKTGLAIPETWDDEVFGLMYDFLSETDPYWYPDAYSIYQDFVVYEPNGLLAEYNYMYPDFVKYMNETQEQRLEGVMKLVAEKTIIWKLDSGNYMVYVNF